MPAGSPVQEPITTEYMKRTPGTQHVVFSNVPGCAGMSKAAHHGAPSVSLDSSRYFHEMLKLENIPRHGVERDSFDIAIMTLVEQVLDGQPDLICLAGYDLWIGELDGEQILSEDP